MSEEVSKETVEQGIGALIGGFNAVISTCFEKSLIVSNETNPFGDLPKHIQLTMIRNAAQILLGQTLASVAVMADGQVEDREVFSAGCAVMKHYFTQYVNQMRAAIDEQKNAVGQGSERGNDGQGIILGSEPELRHDNQG